MGEVGMANNYFNLNDFENSELLVQGLCERIVQGLTNALEEKGEATLALSGGNTPKKLFNTLSKVVIDWENVRVTLVDERWSDSSNEKLIRECLLINSAESARFFPLKTEDKFAINGVASLNNSLENFFKEFDVVVLGMGLDAHTASFFPNASELNFALNTKNLLCATTANVAPKERISFSKSALLRTKNLFLHIEGKEKKEVFLKASESDDVSKMPIIAMMEQKIPLLEVYYAD